MTGQELSMIYPELWMLAGQLLEHRGRPDTEENRIRVIEVVLSHLVKAGELVKEETSNGYYIIRTAEEDFRPN